MAGETRLEPSPGAHIRDVIPELMVLAERKGVTATADFNGIALYADPGDTVTVVRKRYEDAAGHPVLSEEEERRRLRAEMERTERETREAIEKAGVATEQEMRDAKAPWPKTPEELAEYIETLVDRPHDYGTCVYAMSMAAVAAFNYVGSRLGATGFQASCADMDILRRTRRIEGGFRIVNYDDLLYPQYWDKERRGIFRAVLTEDPETYREKARELLASNRAAAPAVRYHWERIADTPAGETESGAPTP